MLFTASNVHDWKKIEMDAQRLLIWEVRERICFTRKRLFGTTSLYLLYARAPDVGRVKGRVEARLKNLPIFFFS